MNKEKRFLTTRPVLPGQKENVKVIRYGKISPDTADSFVPRKKNHSHCNYLLSLAKAGEKKIIPFQLSYCIFPIMSDMFRSLSVRQLWRIIQLWSIHSYQSHIHLLGYCKSVTGNDLRDIVTKQSPRTQPLMKWMLCTFFLGWLNSNV